MSWKNELDRTLCEAVAKATADTTPDFGRATHLVNDLVAATPGRAESHFLAGWLEETRARHAAKAEAKGASNASPAGGPSLSAPPAPAADAAASDAREAAAPADSDAAAAAAAPAPEAVLVSSPEGDPSLWRWLGRLDGAARGSDVSRVVALCAEPYAEVAVLRAREGRAALRAASRALLVSGADARAYELYAKHLASTNDEGSRRDADWLVGDAARRADDLAADGDEAAAVSTLERALAFATSSGLDARTHAKVERKIGRLHQLAGRFDDAATRYRGALSRMDPADRYRSVLHGDLALASLGVRGTLDLMPVENRPGAAEAERLLTADGTQGEGESYNAIYTLGMLAYERADFGAAATRFREADRLMRETRAKARIVHARARFFLGACILKQGATGEALAEAEQYVTRDASAAALEPAVKEPIFELLLLASPNARIPGREPVRQAREPRDLRSDSQPRDTGLDAPRDAGFEGPPRPFGDRPPREGGRGRRGGRGGGRGDRGDDRGPRRDQGDRPAAAERMGRYGAPRPPARDFRPDSARGDAPRPMAASSSNAPGEAGMADAAAHLAEARRVLVSDPHRALLAVDFAFKARPGFEDWYAAYRIRLDALVTLNESAEAVRTYERFRAKLFERGRTDRLEGLLLDGAGPLPRVMDEGAILAEKVNLYEAMPGRDVAFVEACAALARRHEASRTQDGLRRAAALMKEAAARDGSLAGEYARIVAEARSAGVSMDAPSADEMKARLSARSTPARVVLVAGDEARKTQVDAVQDLGRRVGFEGSWVVAGARPPHKTLADVEASCRQGASAIVVHHTATADLREGVRRLAANLSVPMREIPYAGAAGIEGEVLTALGETL